MSKKSEPGKGKYPGKNRSKEEDEADYEKATDQPEDKRTGPDASRQKPGNGK